MKNVFSSIWLWLLFTINLNAQISSTVYVAADGTGDYQCDGVSDQVEINQALDFVAAHAGYNTVYLKGPHTYIIDDPILISNDCKLIADSGVVVRVQDSVNWPINKPVIGQKGAEYWQGGEHESSLVDQIYGQSKDSLINVEIAGFEITVGNQDASSGSWYYIIMLFHKVRNLNVHNMYLHDNFGDFIRIMGDNDLYSRNVHIHHNRMMHSGHDGLYFVGIDTPEIDHNTIEHTRTNDGIRLEECRHVNVHDNVVGNSLTRVPSGYAGIILENDDVFVESGNIYGNFIYGKAGGIVLRGGPTKEYMRNIHIHHNRIYQTFDNTAGGVHFLNGAIHLHDADHTLIEFNTIEGSQKDGIVFELTQGTESGYQTFVRNNIIAHCANYGINNLAPSIYHRIQRPLRLPKRLL